MIRILSRILGVVLLANGALAQGVASEGNKLTGPEVSTPRTLELLGAIVEGDAAKLSLLLDVKENSLREMPDGEPTIFLAARYGTPGTLKVFFAAGVDPNAAGKGGWTPLLVAIVSDRADNVEALLEAGANATAPTSDGITPLAMATANGNGAIVDLLRSRQPQQSLTEEARKELLFQAAALGDSDAVKAALAHVTGPDVADDRGWTALLYATAAQREAVIALLLERRANINHAARNGITALMIAAMSGNGDLVNRLLARGADKSMRNDFGQTAATIAQNIGAKDVIGLLDAGGDAAAMHRRVAAAAARKDGQDLKALLDAGAPAARPPAAAQDTPAIVAASCAGASENLKLLLDKGAKPDEADAAGVTPLIAAALCNRLESARILLAAKASTQPKTRDGIDALTAASARGHSDIVAALAPAAIPTIAVAVEALQRKDLKTLALLLKARPALLTDIDRDGRTLLQQTILHGDQAAFDMVMPQANLDKIQFGDTPLITAITANRPQAIRTLLRLGARPTLLMPGYSTAFDVAGERKAAEALQLMSQAARKEILEIQSLLFSLGLLKTVPDGSWGAGTQTAWNTAKKEILNGIFGPTVEEALTNVTSNYVRVCNQTGADRSFALLVYRPGGADEMHGWYDIDNGKCTWLWRSAPTGTEFYVGATRGLSNARYSFCTLNKRMDAIPEADTRPPCKTPYNPTPFVKVEDIGKPFVAR